MFLFPLIQSLNDWSATHYVSPACLGHVETLSRTQITEIHVLPCLTLCKLFSLDHKSFFFTLRWVLSQKRCCLPESAERAWHFTLGENEAHCRSDFLTANLITVELGLPHEPCPTAGFGDKWVIYQLPLGLVTMLCHMPSKLPSLQQYTLLSCQPQLSVTHLGRCYFKEWELTLGDY